MITLAIVVGIAWFLCAINRLTHIGEYLGATIVSGLLGFGISALVGSFLTSPVLEEIEHYEMTEWKVYLSQVNEPCASYNFKLGDSYGQRNSLIGWVKVVDGLKAPVHSVWKQYDRPNRLTDLWGNTWLIKGIFLERSCNLSLYSETKVAPEQLKEFTPLVK